MFRSRGVFLYIPAVMLVAATAEFSMGRKLWGASGVAGLWSGDIWSSHNSQFLLDPYSFTHITHGILFFGLLVLVLPKITAQSRLWVAVTVEAAWEVLENTSVVIERYRAETISLNYYGDSVINSMGDILACVLGFYFASRLPTRVTVIGTIALELLLLFWTRDNLALNVVMLIHPSGAIRAWQAGQ